jgi:DNA invertase Pin-like site-specific DNA recombinase
LKKAMCTYAELRIAEALKPWSTAMFASLRTTMPLPCTATRGPEAGCKTIFKDDSLSGATTKRPALQRCLITMLDALKAQGVKFHSLTEAIGTTTPTGCDIWQMIGILAELERSLFTARTRAGVKAAKRRGVKFGRKPKLTALQI